MRSKILTLLLAPLLGFTGDVGHPFDYDLHLFSIPGNNQRTMICFHGYGDNYQIAEALKNLYQPNTTLVSFNFPEYDIKQGKTYDPKTASFGTIDEILPALYVMKKIVVDQGLESIDLYGFSAGGGAVVNTIAVLNGAAYDSELKKIGIGAEEKKRLLSAIQQGIVILDAPLKSVEEIMDFRGSSEEFEVLAKKYREHGLRPIDSLKMLKGLALNVLLYFDKKDEVLSNRDDLLYIQGLKDSQPSERLTVIIGDEGGHMAPHCSLWEAYSKKTGACSEEMYFQFMKTSEGKIAYIDSGGEGLPLVFIHGNSCSSKVFKKQIAYFSPQCRVVAIDLPGHGKSDHANHLGNAYTIPGYAKILDEVTKALKLKEFIVVGFSLGGNIALQWTQVTDRIKGVMMISSAPMKYSEEAFLAYPPYEGSYAASPNALTESQAMQYMGAGGFDTKDPAVYFMIQDAMKTDGAARATMVASVLAGKGVDETQIVSELVVPLAVVIGVKDNAIGVKYISQLHYLNLWQDGIKMIADAQHAIVYHQAEQVNVLLENFIQDVKEKSP